MKPARYAELGKLIARHRAARGLANQGDLARALKSTQQTVSRWEAGTSRPRANQIDQLAATLGVAAEVLMEAAGYRTAVIQSITKLFPFDALAPDIFEQLVLWLVRRMHPGADVSRAGKSGHKQGGLDVLAVLPNGERHTFQVKRVQTFGPREVELAVRAHSAQSDRCHLVLSRIASPQTASAVRDHGWLLWDQEQLSWLIRDLSMDDQLRLVDIFFHGQREVLLGRPEPGPWMTTEEFFQPLTGREGFSHDLDLVGRTDELTRLKAAIRDTPAGLIVLSGPGGIGKSRLLKQAIEDLERDQAHWVVRWLSNFGSPTPKSFEDLGRGRKILVVDDAHDREDVAALMAYATVPSNQTSLVLSTRPYALPRIEREAAALNLASVRIDVGQLSVDDTRQLATNAVGPKAGAAAMKQVASAFRESPLLTVIAAKVMAKEGLLPEAAKSAAPVRNVVLQRFKKVVVGDLGWPGDEPATQEILEALALLQPFHIEDPGLLELLEKQKGISADKATRIFRRLVEGGVIYRRAQRYRLMPDVLGDYIIQESALSATGTLSPFARHVLETADSRQLEHVLVNLGRLEWRMRYETAPDTALLEDVWRSFGDLGDEYDARLSAIRAVAVYQPKQALDFVVSKLRKGVYLHAFPEIMNAVAHNIDYVEGACDALWFMDGMAKHEQFRSTASPIDTLANLCGFQEHKPLEFSRRAFEFCLKLLDRPDAWARPSSPLRAVKKVLDSEGVSTESQGVSIVLSSFLVDLKVVTPLRQRLIGKVIELLFNPKPAVAAKAASFLNEALRHPMGMMGGSVPERVHRGYAEEFNSTLDRLADAVGSGQLLPTTLLNIARSVHWHAMHGRNGTKEAARAVLAKFPNDVHFRGLAALAQGFGDILDLDRELDDWSRKGEKRLQERCAELKAMPSSELLDWLEGALGALTAAGEEKNSSYILVNQLMRDDLDLARGLVERVEENPRAEVAWHLHSGLAEILNCEPAEGRRLVAKYLRSPNPDFALSAAMAISNLRREFTEADRDLLSDALASADAKVCRAAIRAFWSVRDEKAEMVRLIRHIQPTVFPQVAEDAFLMLREQEVSALDFMAPADIEYFLGCLARVPRLQGHWTQQFLSELSCRFPRETWAFFAQRVEYALEQDDYSFLPVNHGPYVQKPLRFSETEQASAILEQTWRFLRKLHRENVGGRSYIADFFEGISGGGGDAELVRFLETKVGNSGAEDLELIGMILRGASSQLAFSHRDFVERLLDRCSAIGSDLVESVSTDIYCATTSGVRSGVMGEPMPRDVQQRDQAQAILASTSRLAPAYQLYEWIAESANRSIARSEADVEALDL